MAANQRKTFSEKFFGEGKSAKKKKSENILSEENIQRNGVDAGAGAGAGAGRDVFF